MSAAAETSATPGLAPLRTAARLRPRQAYEAVDFGFHFVRAHYVSLLVVAASLCLPLAIALVVVLPGQIAWLGLGVWWLKPVWERAVLLMLSRALFGDRPSWSETLRGFRGIATRDLLPSLTWRRLSPTRSFDLPVTVLEGSTGPERGARLSILHRGSFPAAAVCLSFLLIHVEFAIALGFPVLIQLLTPDLFEWNALSWIFGLEDDPGFGAQLFAYAAGTFALLLVCPYYVGAGFSLYLHRRTELEAWDLEIAFRRLADRARAQRRRTALPRADRRDAKRAVSAGVGALGILGIALASAAPGQAETRSLEKEEARAAIEEILAGEAFHQRETIRLPRWLLEWQLERQDEERDTPAWLERFAQLVDEILGGGLEILIVSVALGLAVWLALRIAGQRGLAEASRPRRSPRARPTELFGLEVTEESLPDDLSRVALAKAEAGDRRGALALLYRGALSRLALVYGAALSKGVTERECLEAARPLLPAPGTRYFEGLTRTWLFCAYGHRIPANERLESLCRDWPRWFEERASPAPTVEAADVE